MTQHKTFLYPNFFYPKPTVMGKCQNPSWKDSAEGDNKYLVKLSSYSIIYANYVSMITRKYVTFQDFNAHFDVHSLTEYMLSKNQAFS